MIADELVVFVLTNRDRRSVSQLSALTGLWEAVLYPALYRLEQAGKIVGDWDEGPYPRTRRYSLAVTKGQ